MQEDLQQFEFTARQRVYLERHKGADQVAETIRQARAEARFTQQQLAIAMKHRGAENISQQRISDWERGRAQPTVTELRLFQALVNSRKIRDLF
jgi:DNA-binding transcriptional regulator YiaG